MKVHMDRDGVDRREHQQRLIHVSGWLRETSMKVWVYPYNTSPAATKAVWDGADAHLLAVYGFSILENVKEN
ncbi:hypothetical protein DFP72DRAFT_889519 [Ephemerocybe angulata]|uniref:Uncharacterized protein n=1 Tax=Ephemerocybe angulata TaxID=980116 RepID=A0A8H6I3C4_9AGAR|nr:hypothetical protein DFP72DRAFT_889519 [Tulosesus angulatus]